MASWTCSSFHQFGAKRFLLLLFLIVFLCVSSFSVADGKRKGYLGRRRALLASDEETEKVIQLKKKKKKSSSDNEVVEPKFKKKATELDDQLVRKKSTIEDFGEQSPKKSKRVEISETEDQMPKKKTPIKGGTEEPLSNKKKNVVTEEIEDQVPMKKKKKTVIQGTEEELPTKKKIATEESEDKLPKKKKKDTTDNSEDQAPKKKKKPTTDQLDDQKAISKKSSREEAVEGEIEDKPKKKKVHQKEDDEDEPKKKKSIPGTKLLTSNSGEDDDLMTELTDLPSKLHRAIGPDIERISTTSKLYLNRANRGISQTIKPIVGSKNASIIASISTSCYIFLLAPLLLASLLYSRSKANYQPLRTILIFAHAYLSIYFSVLSLAYWVTGLEPLRAFYANSKASYAYTQILQGMAYMIYLLMVVVYLVVVFSTKEGGPWLRAVGLAQAIAGLGVGAHYYVEVVHRAVAREPPKTSWKAHVVYAILFAIVGVIARAERRKKVYLKGVEEGKMK